MYQKAIALWHALSATEQQELETLARPKHMTGFAYFISLALKPNPGLYLPLQGGTMQGDIDMASYRLLTLIDPILDQEAATKKYHDDNLPAGGYTEGARVYHSEALWIPNNTWTALPFNSERFDTDTIHDTVTNNSRLTCKTTGKYVIAGNIQWEPSATGMRYFKIKLNNGPTIAQTSHLVVTAHEDYMALPTIYHLEINNFVELNVYQNSGGTLILRTSPQNSPEFMMQRIGQ